MGDGGSGEGGRGGEEAFVKATRETFQRLQSVKLKQLQLLNSKILFFYLKNGV
jgi:hypothetical protein